MERRTGKVLRIEKASIHDGDGLRTVVFMKGLPTPVSVVFDTGVAVHRMYDGLWI